MARNNRELSQLGAFISITDNSQEIDAGTFDGEVVSRHVMSIGAVDNTGLTVPPAIGIGTTNPGDKLTVVSEVDIAGGNGLVVSGDVVVEQSSEYKGLVSINAGFAGIDSTALRVAYGRAEFGCSEIAIGTAVNETSAIRGSEAVGVGTTNISLNLSETNVTITTSFSTSSGAGLNNSILSNIPVKIDYGHHYTNFPEDDADPSLGNGGRAFSVVGYSSFAGPVHFGDGPVDYDTIPGIGTPTTPFNGSVSLDLPGGGISVAGPIFQGGGDINVESITVNPVLRQDGQGFIELPDTLIGDHTLRAFSGLRVKRNLFTEAFYCSAQPGIATFNNVLVIDNGNTLNGVGTGWNQGIGSSLGPSLQVGGSAQFDGGIRVGLASRAPGSDEPGDKNVSIQCGAGITATNIRLYGDGAVDSFADLQTVNVSLGKTGGDFPNLNNVKILAPIQTDLIPFYDGVTTNQGFSLGLDNKYWSRSFVDEANINKLSISTSIVNAGGYLQTTGIATFINDSIHVYTNFPALFETPIHATGISSFRSIFVDNLTVGEDIVGTAITALRSKTIDVGSASTAQFYRVVLTDADGDDPESRIFADPDVTDQSLAYDPVTNILNVPGDIRISGTDAGSDDGIIQILAPQARSTLRMFQTNVSSAEILTQGHRSLSVGSTLGITTINSYKNSIRGELWLGALGITTATIKDVNGLENITITGNTLTEFAGNMAMDGDTFDVRNDIFNFCNSNSTNITAFALGDNISIGATVGFTSIRNPILRTAGSIRVDGDLISDSSGSDHIIMTPASGGADAITRLGGDLQVDGRDIRVAGGITNITMNTDINTTFAGDITVGGNEIRNGDGQLNITLFGGGLTSIGGTLRVEGDEIQAGTGVTNITLTSNYTQIEKDLRINGDNIRASDNNINITMDGGSRTSVAGNLSVGNNTIEASDQTTSIVLSPSSGSVAISSNLTVNNDLEVVGSETDIKSENVRIKDTLVSIGLTAGTGTGPLVVPTVDENKDVGLLLNYYDAGSKQAAVFWDDSTSTVGIASDVTETSSVLTVNQYAKIIAKSIAISDCAGTSDIIQCEGTTRTLANIVIDGGEY